MLLTATSTAAALDDLISIPNMNIIKANNVGRPMTVFLQNTQASATLYLSFNSVTATTTTSMPLATNDSITFVTGNLASISLVSSAATNTVIFEVIQ